MKTDTLAVLVTVVAVAATLVVTGPLVGSSAGGPTAGGLDDGTATAESVALAGPFALEQGRFGTGVVYLRVPPATVELASVSGHPRLVYSVSVPGLGFERVGTRQVDADTRQATVTMSDRAFVPERVSGESYRVRVSVRVQSFAVDRVVYRHNETVEGPPDG